MAFTVRFLLKDNGEIKPMSGGIQEVSGEDNIRNILNTKIHDIIRLGIAPDKRAYRVIKITRKADRQQEDLDLHIDIIVEKV